MIRHDYETEVQEITEKFRILETHFLRDFPHGYLSHKTSFNCARMWLESLNRIMKRGDGG